MTIERTSELASSSSSSRTTSPRDRAGNLDATPAVKRLTIARR